MIQFKFCSNFVIITCLLFTFIRSKHLIESEDINVIGVSKKDIHLYHNQDLICPSTGKKLTPNMINDGRCDCPDDGFDEPGTASCEKGKFYCKNMGNQMKYISSFKVNDGVCDCCDGSDEYLDLFSIKCPNTCAEASKTLKRAAYLEKAKQKKAQKHYFVSKSFAIKAQDDLKAKLDEINSKLAEINKKAETIPLTLETTDSSSTDNLETFLADYRLKLDQLEQLIANLTSTTQSTSEPSNVITNDLKESNPTTDSKINSWKNLIAIKLRAAKENILRFASVNINKKPTIVTKFLPTIVTKTIIQYDYKPTKTFDDQYNELDYEKDELVTQAKEIEESFKDPNIFGPDSVFLSLKDKCFSFESGEYVYSLCWFKDAKQENRSGSTQILGKWGYWASSSSKSQIILNETNFNFKHMIYTDGNNCGKKARDVNVHLECGWDDQIISVDEPSMCSYVFRFSTPLACII